MNDDNLLRYKKNFRYMTYDSETEGLNPYFHRPWQIGWSITENGRIISTKQYHLKIPNLNVSPGAARVTHFDINSHNRIARDPLQVYEEFAADFFDEKNTIVAQNFYFDMNMFHSLRRLIGINDFVNVNHRLYDTIALSKAMKLNINPPENREDYIKWQFSMLNFRQKGLKTGLELVCKEFNIEFLQHLAHESKYDCIKTSELFQKLIWAVRVY